MKYGLIKLIDQKADLCEQMENVDEKCPLKGEKTITKDVDLPRQIPPVSLSLAISCVARLINVFQGQIYRPRRRLHEGRRANYVLDRRSQFSLVDILSRRGVDQEGRLKKTWSGGSESKHKKGEL